MNDALVVGELKRIADLRHDGQRFARRDAAIDEQLSQVYAVHIFHHEEMHAARLAELVEGDDTGMVELRERLGFASKTFGKGRVAADAGRENFERDEAIQSWLPGLVDGTHAALANEFKDFQLRKESGKLFHRGWDERGSLGPGRFHAGGKTGLNEAFWAKTQRHIRGERFLAAWANAFCIHYDRRFYPVLRNCGRKVTG